MIVAETSWWCLAGEVRSARQRLITSRKRVLRGKYGRPCPRSVDSECAGRVIEPREKQAAEADAIVTAEGSTERPEDHGPGSSAGVGEQGTRAEAP